jgi:hypothetical protein
VVVADVVGHLAVIYGLSGAPVPSTLPYAGYINRACDVENFPPAFAYAIAWRETISGEGSSQWTAATVVSSDGGHGLYQLTASYPDDWQDPRANCEYAIDEFLRPAVSYWHGLEGYSGDDLVRLVAATFNAGLGNARAGHGAGNVDLYTTQNYAAGVLAIYKALIATGKPE